MAALASRRAFVALFPEARDARRLARRAAPRLAGYRPVPWLNYHLTLAWIGPLEEAQCGCLAACLPDLARLLPKAVAVRAIAPFPHPGGRLLAAEIACEEALCELHEAVGARLAQFGLAPPARPFRPHVTLGRADGGARRPPAPSPCRLRLAVAALGLYHGRTENGEYRYVPLAKIAARAADRSG